MKNKIFLAVSVIVILCIAWMTVQAKFQQTNAPRQQWEYKTVTMQGTHAGWEKWWEDAQELPLPVNGIVKRVELGNAGWELVAVATIDARNVNGNNGGTDQLIQYFKRPK